MQLLARTRQVEREQAEKREASRLHNASFWVEKFMSSATQQADPELAGHHEENASPLVAVEQARWRKTLSDVRAADAAAAAAQAAVDAELRSREEGALAFVVFFYMPGAHQAAAVPLMLHSGPATNAAQSDAQQAVKATT